MTSSTGLPRNTPVDTGAVTSSRDAHVPRSYVRDATGKVSADIQPREILGALREPSKLLWVDIDSANRHQHAILEKLFGFHPLAVEDTLNPNSRVKIEAYDNYLFIVLRAIRFLDETEDPYDLDTTNLYLFLGPTFLVTVHSEPSASIANLQELVSRSPDILDRGSARLAHLVVDSAIDAYFPILDQIDEHVDALEDRVFHRFDDRALHDIFALKRTVLSLRRYLAPQREVFNILTNRPSPLLSPEAQIYFRDVYDHLLRINDSLDTYRELLSNSLDSYLTQVSNRLGSITKGLSVVATLSVPFVVISGMWGMNFAHIPLSQEAHGFWSMLALQLGLGVGLLALLRWRRLL